MAVSLVGKHDFSGLAVLRDLLRYFQATLYQFRICHDLCATCDLLNEQSVRRLDKCAATFRHLSTTVATLTEKVASVWCRTCLLFYQNVNKMKGSPVKIFETIHQQSKELSENFKEVVVSANNLGKQFKSIEARERPAQQELDKVFQNAEAQLNEQKTKVRGNTEAGEISEPTTELTTEVAGESCGNNTRFTFVAPPEEKPEEKPVQEAFVDTFESLKCQASKAEKEAVKEAERAKSDTKAAKYRIELTNALTTMIPPVAYLFPKLQFQATLVLVDAEEHERAAIKLLKDVQQQFNERTDQAEEAKVSPKIMASLRPLLVPYLFIKRMSQSSAGNSIVKCLT